MAYFYNHCLSDTPMFEHCIDSVEDVQNFFFTTSKYTTFRNEHCQTLQNAFDCGHIFDIDLLFYVSPNHGLNT